MKKQAHSKSNRTRRVLTRACVAAACLTIIVCAIIGINTSNTQSPSTTPASSEQQTSSQGVAPSTPNTAALETTDNSSAPFASLPEGSFEPGVVLVHLEDESQAQNISRQLSQLDYVADATPNAVDAHAGFISVKLAEGIDANTATGDLLHAGFDASLNRTLELADAPTNDPRVGDQWAIDAVDASNAWALKSARGTTSDAISVAIIDTGCQTNHEDIKDNIYTKADGSQVVYDASTTATTIDFNDNNGHGTHVAGIVAAGTNNGLGVAGMSYNEKIIPIKVQNNDGTEIYYSSIIRGLTWVKDHHSEYNIRVVNISLAGDRKDRPQTLDDADSRQMISLIDDLHESGVLVVCASGNKANEGSKGAYYNFPSDYSSNIVGVIALGSGTTTSMSDAEKRTRANYSNYNVSGQKTKTISAPGTAIVSTWPTSGYQNKNGTSMASPCVAGIAAMVFAVNSSLSANDVRDIIYATATDLDTSDDATNSTTWSDGYGYGEIEAYHAMQIATAKLAFSSDQIECFSTSNVSIKYADRTGWTGDSAYGSAAQWSWSASDDDPNHEVAIVAVGNDGTVTVSGTHTGTATITATFKDANGNNSAYSISKNIEVTSCDISKASITAENQTYTGSALTPTPTVTLNGQRLTEGSDYTVASYSDNVNAGLGKITITGTGEYSGEATGTFIIGKASITTPAAATGLVYSGSEQTGVSGGNGYSVSGGKGTGAGNYTATVRLNDAVNTMWAGTSSTADLSISWSIAKADVTAPKAATGLVYNGSEQTGVSGGNGYSVSGGKGTNAASYTATAKLNDTINTKWAGTSSSAELKIPWSIAKAEVEVPAAATGLVFNGREQTGIARSNWYTLSGTASATNAGTYTATAKLNDTVNTKWAGTSSSASRSVVWSIASRPIKDTSISFPAKTYTGSAQAPAPTITLSGYGKLRQYSDYEIKSYANNVNAGTATVTITGKGNFSGQTNATFTIAPVDISSAIISGVGAQAYTGSPITPSVSVLYNGRALSSGSDFTLSYANNVNPGTATVTATGTGNYTGSKSTTFAIEGSVSPSAGDSTMYRLYNPNSGEHFYTASAGERDMLVSVGWNSEGKGWTSPSSSNTPVYRMYNANGGEHHYTMSAGERDMLVSVGWSYEGIGWYSDDQQRVVVFRDYNPNAFANNHNYTTSAAEHEMLMAAGWRSEGYAWYGM